MRLAIYIRSIRSARGAERVAANVAKSLADRGHLVSFLLEDAEGWLVDELSGYQGIEVVNLREQDAGSIQGALFRVIAFARAILAAPFEVLRGRSCCLTAMTRVLVKEKPPLYALHQFLKSTRPGAVLSFLNYPNLVLLLSSRMGKSGARIYVNVRNQISLSSEHGKSRWARSVPKLMRCFFPLADGVVAPSRGVADDVVEITGIDTGAISVIHNPVFRPEILQLAAEPSGHSWLDEPAGPVIVAAGKLEAQKDYASLLNAFALVRQRKADVRLILLGDGRLRGALESQARELGIDEVVDMPGHVRNPYAFFHRASVFVLSSLWEGLPNVLIEAMACGTPVVATDCPSGPVEILENGRYGELVPVGDIDALATAILHTLEQPLSSEDVVGRARQFSMESAAAGYERLLTGAE